VSGFKTPPSTCTHFKHICAGGAVHHLCKCSQLLALAVFEIINKRAEILVKKRPARLLKALQSFCRGRNSQAL
jgi:hypothetical protein